MAERSPAELAGDYDGVALVLQGGGALGAYQAGVFEALTDNDIDPTWVGGVSIGAVNAALIAGNAPENRCAALHGFWDAIASPPLWGPLQGMVDHFAAVGDGRAALNQLNASLTALRGQTGFFEVRVPPPWLRQPGTVAATSFYDTAPLVETLERFIDLDRLNSGAPRITLSAVNVVTGNLEVFDSAKRRIEFEHIMASGALPPGFPYVTIGDNHYWDAGVISNTPLCQVLDEVPRRNMLIFQVDLWSARGKLPEDIVSVNERVKDLTYSSKTRLNTDHLCGLQQLRGNLYRLLEKLPESLRDDPEVAALREVACPARINVIHLIYQAKNFERDSRDYEFSALTMREHWRSGRQDTMRTLHNVDWLEMPPPEAPVATHDLHRRDASQRTRS
jgi:NTE family protein